MAQKVRCLENYHTERPGLYFDAGQVYEMDPEKAAWLMRDAPGCFELVREPEPEPEPKPRTRRKSVKKPPQNKAVLEPVEEKDHA